MILRTVQSKLLITIIMGLILLGTGIFIIADHQLRRFIDKSQNALYEERLSGIIDILEQDNERLEKTGFIEAYRESIQELSLSAIRHSYYERDVKPVILDEFGKILLHPEMNRDSYEPDLAAEIEELKFIEHGELYHRERNGTLTWLVSKYYEPWRWYVIYRVPVSTKYAAAVQFSQTLGVMILITFLLTGVIIAYFITRTAAPISRLTDASIAMSKGDLDFPIESERNDEIGVLAKSFNKMRTAIKQQLQSLEREITDRKDAEIRVAESQAFLEVLVEELPIAIQAVEPNHLDTVFQNKEWKNIHVYSENGEMSNYSANPDNEKPQLCFIDGTLCKDDEYPLYMALTKGEETYNKEMILKWKEEKEKLVLCNAAPVKNEAGKIIYGIISYLDITNSRRLEDELRQSQKLDAIGQMAGGIAHDFNNMLAGIMGAAQMLGTTQLPSDAKEFLKLILDASSHAAELTEKLLAFGRKSKVSFELVDVHEVIQTAVSILERTINKKVTIETTLVDESTCVTGDKTLLQNVIMNLGINADHAMPGGGLLKIWTEQVHLKQGYCAQSLFNIKPGAYVGIHIVDNGEGIEPAHVTRIFEPFFTTKEKGKGTGLGLAAVYGIVKQHHGEITLTSTIGKGTEFIIHLPLSIPDLHEKDVPSENLKTGEGHILIVDDESVVRTTLKVALSKLGYTVTVAEDGIKGFNTFEELQDQIDLVILDMVMPGMTGRECFIAMKEVNPDIKVILASGYAQNKDIEFLRENGLSDYISKPFNIADLSAKIADVLRGDTT